MAEISSPCHVSSAMLEGMTCRHPGGRERTVLEEPILPEGDSSPVTGRRPSAAIVSVVGACRKPVLVPMQLSLSLLLIAWHTHRTPDIHWQIGGNLLGWVEKERYFAGWIRYTSSSYRSDSSWCFISSRPCWRDLAAAVARLPWFFRGVVSWRTI